MKTAKEKNKISSGTGLVIGIAVIYILLGLAMLFIPNFQSSYIIYAAGLILVVYGIILIVKYFLNGSYRDLGKYGFSCGVLCVLIGICMLIRASEISVYFPVFLGICILLTSIIKLQNAVDLKSIGNPVWIVFLVIAVAFLAAALCIILNPMPKVTENTTYIYYILTADGIVNLISTFYLAFAIHMSRKKPEKPEISQDSEEEWDVGPAKEMSETDFTKKEGSDTGLLTEESGPETLDSEEKQTAEEAFASPEAEDDIEEEILSVFGKSRQKRGKREK